MNQKELISLSKGSLEFREDENVVRLEDLHKFLESNVCIPKGENRHPYADVLHEWIETNRQLEFRFCSNDKWSNVSLKREVEYRIKPSDPIYEWQWKYRKIEGSEWIGYTKYHSDKQFKDCDRWHKDCYYEKDETTKRIRK